MKRYYKFVLLSFVLSVFFIVEGCGIQSAYIRDDVQNEAGKLDSFRIESTVFLIGDAGESEKGKRDPVFLSLEREASVNPEKNIILFLGDNIYPNGMQRKGEDGRKESEFYLDEQIKIMENSGARGIFIPGNHDWKGGGKEGLKRLMEQQDYIEGKSNPKIDFLPKNGCPGPEVVDFGENVRIIVLDTQWWLNDKNYSEKCSYTKQNVLDALKLDIANAESRYVIIAGHHPLATHGSHGGFYDWEDHIFPLRNLAPYLWIPLPIVGSLYPLLRNSRQDLSNDVYMNMVKSFEKIFKIHTPLVYAAGHEHVLQVLEGDGNYLNLVSGRGISSHTSEVTYEDDTIFADVNPGYMRIDFFKNRDVKLSVIEPIGKMGISKTVFSTWLIKK